MPIKSPALESNNLDDSDVPIRLGPRLAAVADLAAWALADGNCRRTLADIGSDHAYLPAFLLRQNIIDRAVAVDVHEGPFQNILRTVSLWGLEDCLEARRGDGLSVLKPGEADVIVAAGMGGGTMAKLLSEGAAVADQARRLVLQPQNAYASLSRFLLTAGWRLAEEALAAEGQEIYRVMCWRRGSRRQDFQQRDSQPECQDWDVGVVREKTALWREQACPEADAGIFASCVWRLGPINIARRDELLRPFADRELSRLARAAAGLSRSGRRESEDKNRAVAAEIKVWEGLLQWLFP
jgi:tRNA (adenine22-N1)-methyltransferase